jgi:hypothetical protein
LDASRSDVERFHLKDMPCDPSPATVIDLTREVRAMASGLA